MKMQRLITCTRFLLPECEVPEIVLGDLEINSRGFIFGGPNTLYSGMIMGMWEYAQVSDYEEDWIRLFIDNPFVFFCKDAIDAVYGSGE